MSKKIDLGTGKIPSLFFRLAMPAVVAQIINLLYNLVDRIYVGGIKDIGTDALAGLGVCFPILLLVSAFSALVGLGGSPLASIKLGEKNIDGAEKILNNGFVILGIMGIALTFTIYFLSEDLLKLFGSPESSLQYGNDYLKIYSLGTIFVMFSLGLNTFISAQGFAVMSMATVAIGAVLNIVLDPLFIFVFDMGVKGAAIATVISQAISCLWVVIFFISKKSTIRLKPKYFKPDMKIIFPMLALGIAPFIMQATESAVQIVFNVQLFAYTDGNKDYTAALTIMMSVMQIITLPLNGMGTGAQPLISYNYGAGNMTRVKKTIKLLFCVAFSICAIIWIICLSVPQVFGMIFSATPQVNAIISKFMPIFMMGTIFFCSQFALQSSFLALGQAKISMCLALLRKVILLIPLTFLLPLAFDVKGIFLAEGISDLAAGAITTLTFALTFKKILNKRQNFLTQHATQNANALTENGEGLAIDEDICLNIVAENIVPLNTNDAVSCDSVENKTIDITPLCTDTAISSSDSRNADGLPLDTREDSSIHDCNSDKQ